MFRNSKKTSYVTVYKKLMTNFFLRMLFETAIHIVDFGGLETFIKLIFQLYKIRKQENAKYNNMYTARRSNYVL